MHWSLNEEFIVSTFNDIEVIKTIITKGRITNNN